MANQSKRNCRGVVSTASREKVVVVCESKVFFFVWCWNKPSGANVTRRTQKEPNENGIGRGRIRHTPKGEISTSAVGGADPPLEPVVMSHDWGAISKRDQARRGIATSTGQRFGEEARRARVKTKLRKSCI